MKRPSFQFYPADWRKDQGLKLCSLAARGLWIDLMCLMHDAEPYGYLTINGQPMQPEQIARLIGESPKDVRKCMSELQENNVFSITESGIIFSRRMVKDESIREARASGGQAGAKFGKLGAEHGTKGGRPKGETGDKKPPFDTPLEPPPSSSSSSSSSTSVNPPHVPVGGGDHFLEFWSAYPKKVGKGAAEKAWSKAKINGHAADVIAAVQRQKQSEQWQKENGQYIPNPATWITQRRWEDELPITGSSGQPSLLAGVL